MKKFYIISILFLVTLKLFAQNFAPVGAEWYFNEKFAFSGNIDYIKFTSEKDTLINGEICKKIIKRHKLKCNDRPDIEFLFSRNDTVFFLDTIFNEFQILYVLSAQVSDSWIIKVKDEEQDVDTILITVDSILTEKINGFDLKALHVTYNKSDENTPETYTSTIIEKIGDIHYMFNWYPWSMIACDENMTDGLRCYQDSEIGLYSTGIVDSCDYYYEETSIKKNDLQNNFTLFPNPTTGQIQIIFDSEKILTVELSDLMGRLIQSRCFFSNTQLDLTKFQKGLYIVTIKLNDKILGTKKIIKY